MKRYIVTTTVQTTIAVAIGIPLTLFWNETPAFFKGCAFGLMVALGSWSNGLVEYILHES